MLIKLFTANNSGGIGDFIKGNLANGQKVLEMLNLDPSFSVSYSVSSSEVTATQLSAVCPEGLTCGLVGSAYRLKVTGKKYHVYEGNVPRCLDNEVEDTVDFAAVCLSSSSSSFSTSSSSAVPFKCVS